MQNAATAIERRPLRSEVRRALIDRLLNGSLPAGERINESTLAEQLGVSRTPLREALFGLDRDGFLFTRAGKGFVVRPLTIDEVRELYPIIGSLEGLALRLTGPRAAKAVAGLRSTNRDLKKARNKPEDLLRIDAAWHGALVALCPNKRLVSMIARLKEQALRYEYAYMRSAGQITMSVDEHAEMARLLQSGEVTRAARLLESHWIEGVRPLERWIKRHVRDPRSN
jgi:DNA-binding GntR family transcriptional regulator